jgi:beta-glucanase (GH16 family)
MDGAGNLVITAKQESMSGKSYTSARIKTQGLQTFTYGRIEARMKISQGQGLWPAFWMLGDDIATNPWPACGEIDIMENIGKEPNIIHGTIHGPGYSAGAGPTKQYTLSAPVASAFHVFAIEWELNAIRWYVDDTLYSTKTPSDIPSSATWVYAHPFFIIVNLAVGGGFPGNPDGTTTFPQQLQVDYVRVCQK